MSRETLSIGPLALTAKTVYDRPIRSSDDIRALAEKVLNSLRGEGLPICQVKDVMDLVCKLVDLEQLK